MEWNKRKITLLWGSEELHIWSWITKFQYLRYIFHPSLLEFWGMSGGALSVIGSKPEWLNFYSILYLTAYKTPQFWGFHSKEKLASAMNRLGILREIIATISCSIVCLCHLSDFVNVVTMTVMFHQRQRCVFVVQARAWCQAAAWKATFLSAKTMSR